MELVMAGPWDSKRMPIVWLCRTESVEVIAIQLSIAARVQFHCLIRRNN